MTDLNFEPMHSVAERLRSREVSAVELAEAALKQVERWSERLNPFITLTADLTLEMARERDRELADGDGHGPLHGIPIVLKDLFDTAGIRTTGGSAAYRERVPEEDATVVRMLRDAGAVFVGKTGMPEFADQPTSTNQTFGLVRNPWNLDLDTAGSSSGTAAAIASGMAWCGPGTDTGGSIRMPSAACGLVGLKPTYGRVSLRGVLPLAASFDHVGPMARNVRDAALLLNALAGYDEADPHCRDLPVEDFTASLDEGIAGLRVAAFSDDGSGDPVVPDILEGFRAGIETLEGAGASVDDVDLSIISRLGVGGDLIFAEVYGHYGHLLEGDAESLSPVTRGFLETGRDATGAEVVAVMRERDTVLHEIERRLRGYDLVVSPTLALHPPPAGEQCLPLLRFTSIWDQNGWPAITVPVEISPDTGLPIGFQIIARPGEEALLLRAARVIEREHALDWPPPALRESPA